MERTDIIMLLADSDIFRKWHWLSYHFSNLMAGRIHPLSDSVIDACLQCERRMPGFAEDFINRIAHIGGREKHIPDWEQILQQLSELHIITQASRWDWPDGTIFEHEPTTAGSQKNPEIRIITPDIELGIEVKTPAIFAHWEERSKNPFQFASRFAPREFIQDFAGENTATLPRDNPIKDFLISAEEKFAPFVSKNPDFIGLLFICWDDHIYEPISSLIQKHCGLLTENSFHRTETDSSVTYPSIAGIVVLRHLLQLIRACRDEPLTDNLKHPLDYGNHGELPWKAFFQNPSGHAVPEQVLECFDARIPTLEMGAEYRPQEFIMWV